MILFFPPIPFPCLLPLHPLCGSLHSFLSDTPNPRAIPPSFPRCSSICNSIPIIQLSSTPTGCSHRFFHVLHYLVSCDAYSYAHLCFSFIICVAVLGAKEVTAWTAAMPSFSQSLRSKDHAPESARPEVVCPLPPDRSGASHSDKH